MNIPRSISFVFPFLPLFLSFFIMKSKGDDGITSSYCPITNCGKLPVKYPFWLQNNITSSQQYCGYKGFGLNCVQSSPTPMDNDQLFLQLPSDRFLVKSINYTNHTLTLVDTNVTANQTCPRPSQNLTLEDLPLDYSVLDLNLTFYFNCNGSLHFNSTPLYPVECLRSGGNMSYVSLDTNHQNETYDSGWHKDCEEKVVATVIQGKIMNNGVLNWVRLFGGMNEGFALDWRPQIDCASCEFSDGQCGFNSRSNDSLCFCKDGPIKNDHCKAKGNRVKLRVKKIAIGVSAAAGSAIFMCLIFCLYQYRNKKKHSREISTYPSSVADPEKDISSCGVRIFDYSELEKATDNFNSERELGDGGFGTVYKGKLQDGREVAVKRLYESNFKRFEQFKNEVKILTRLCHKNLVSLYGCTSRHCRELLLVYEYIPNGTIADHLHGPLARPGSLPWSTRINIAIETASVLSYLHASDVIHRDVKTNNILLDNNFCVKVADFGLSRLFPLNATHISTAPQGTPGYVDPEYHECYHLTDKSDVFSFGVVLIELISSMPAVDLTRHHHEINLSNMAINKIQGHLLHELVDQNLGFESDYHVRMMITDVAELAYQCLQSGRDMRPSMQEVLNVLTEIENKDYVAGNAKEVNCSAENVQVPKNHKLNTSPDSVIEEWVSSTTTPKTSN